MPASPDRTPAQALTRKRRILCIELATCLGSAILGAAFRTGGHTLHSVSLVLFGVVLGTTFHLTNTLTHDWLVRRYGPRKAKKR
jgi:hypothetical protein